MSQGLVLVLMYQQGDEFVYSRYEGRSRTDRFAHAAPLSDFWVQEIRNEPKQFNPDQGSPQAA